MAYTTIQDVPMPAALKYQHYRLKFFENFYALDVDMTPYSTEFHAWANGIWFDNPPDLAVDADIQAADGVGTLTWHREQSPSSDTTIRSMQDFQYGYFEANFRFDAVNGAWPAFWLLSSESMNDRTINSGEFDVMEWMGTTPNQCFAHFHKWAAGGGEMLPEISATFNAPEGFSFGDYHTYAIHWTPGNMDCYIDDVWYGSCAVDHECELQHYYLMLTAQAGLDWKNDPDTLARVPVDQLQVQARWIRVWQAA